ncbi:MBL fold metallo-hydrolase [Gaoshiqia sediminis]|uniref:MBL fold metallo-hydrolase n=1 Tax=Gaoshiqia sediminis TaxID=2986998 RepID=A0AA42C612_9BACT|nr:MBL fold metallo-hydrolase [Gaoshiqia sediminis]MCW0482074.1 MBL fold metallo-hydrolase [Gaoshiqia sediminis]
MKPIFLIALMLACFAGISSSGQEVFRNNELTITKFEKNMWVMETSDHTTMYLIEGTQKAMLIDTGTKTEKLDSIVKLITAKPLCVVVTHLHPDHAGNVRFFDEIHYHPADTLLLGRKGVSYGGKVNFVADGQKIDLGETVLEVRLMPGHTPGSIVLLDWKTGNCYSGDAFGSGQVWMQLQPHVSMATYAESCRKMEALMENGISGIYCGHYPYVKKAFDKAYITDMRILAGELSKGVAPEAKPYSVKVPIGAQNPMITTNGSASIVFDPENIN